MQKKPNYDEQYQSMIKQLSQIVRTNDLPFEIREALVSALAPEIAHAVLAASAEDLEFLH